MRHLLEKAELKKDQNPSHELGKSKVKKFHTDSENIMSMIETTMNPFDDSLIDETSLYCLVDGKKCPDDTKEDLLNMFGLGKKWKDEFIDEC